VLKIDIAHTSRTPNVSIVVEAARKYLEMKVDIRNKLNAGKLVSDFSQKGTKSQSVLASRIAYLQTCAALNVAPHPELFISETSEEINLRHYSLGARGCFALSAGCCKFLMLKRLDLENCMVGVAGCLILSEAVMHCSNLEYVNIGSCVPQSELGNCEELGIAIANFTKPNKMLALIELNLSKNGIIGIPIICWNSLQTEVNRHLSKLDLSHCSLGSAACHPLSQAIQKLAKLTSLNLRWNKFHGDSICELIEVLAVHSHICDLDFSWNSCINRRSSSAIQNMLFRNTVLNTLNLSFCNMKPICATIIGAGYTANHTLRKLYIEGNPVGPQGAFVFLRIASSEFNENARFMSLEGCNLEFDDVEVQLFDFLNPSCTNSRFNLKDEYDWASIFVLSAIRCECTVEIFSNANLDGSSWNLPGNLSDVGLCSLENDTPEETKQKLLSRTEHVTEQRRIIFECIPRTGMLTMSVEYSNPPNIVSELTVANSIKVVSYIKQQDEALKNKKCKQIHFSKSFFSFLIYFGVLPENIGI
jgi:hypothetical protein